jgi:hypothetical protein
VTTTRGSASSSPSRLAEPIRVVRSKIRTARSILRFVQHNRSTWSPPAAAPGEVLLESYPVAETVIPFSYVANVLASRGFGRIVPFGRVRAPKSTEVVYRSFGAKSQVVSRLAPAQTARVADLLEGVTPGLGSKSDLFDLRVQDIWIGNDVYQTYLRGGRPTLDLNDPAFTELLRAGLGDLVYWTDYFDRHDVRAVVTSHDCYLPNILNKIAFQRGVPVFFPGGKNVTRASAPETVYNYFPAYRELFARLPEHEQRTGVATARNELLRRLEGRKSADVPWIVQSAFHDRRRPRVVQESERLKVLICSHCFFDNPHMYGGLLFLDFWEWLSFLGRIAASTDYDWYLKMHPAPAADTAKVIAQIAADFPRFTMVPSDTSHHQLADEGIDWVLTAYGTVGEEYPALGVPVINAGYNPRAAYSFNLHPRTVPEYEQILLNLPRTPAPPMVPEELHEFHYMNHYHVAEDDFFFPSYKQMVQDLAGYQRGGPAVYDYFLDRLTPARHRRIVEQLDAFVASGRTHLFEGRTGDIRLPGGSEPV